MPLRALFLFLLCSQLALGQQAKMHHLELDERDGLLDIEYGEGFQCSRGFIWIPSDGEGISRYDGVKGMTYTNKEHGLKSDFIEYIFEAPDSLIWVISALLGAKNHTTDILNPVTNQVTPFFDFFDIETLNIQPEGVVGAIKNRDGTVWVLMDDQRIFEYDGVALYFWGEASLYERVDKIIKINDSIACVYNTLEIIYVQRSGNIITKQTTEIASKSGWAYRGYNLEYKTIDESILMKKRIGNGTFLFKSHYQQGLEVLDSILPRQDIVYAEEYVGYFFNGVDIFRVSLDTIDVYDYDFKFKYRFESEKEKRLIVFDQAGGIWSTKGRENLERIQPIKKRFHTYDAAIFPSRHCFHARGIVKTKKGELIIAHGGVLLSVSPQDEYRFFFPEKGRSYDFFGLCLSRDERILWLGEGGELFKYNLEERRLEKRYQGLRGISFQPYEDQKGRLWLGGSQGLCWVDEASDQLVEFSSGNEKIEDCTVFYFYENEAGLWICTSNGVYLLDEQYHILEHYNSKQKGKNYLPFDIIAHLEEDQDGSFWLATKGGGLIHWNPQTGTQEQFTKRDGLKHDVLYAAYCDAYNQVWIPSHYNLMRFDKITKEVIIYSEEDGILHSEFNTTSHFKDKAGRFYFGGQKGVISFHPKDFAKPVTDNKLQLTSFFKTDYSDVLVDSTIQSIFTKKSIELNPTDKSFELSFALLDFYNVKRHRYAYKIEGYDQGWQYLERPILKMNRLPYGNYTLRLRGQTTGDPWQEFEFPIVINVIKPYYLQTWFFAVITALLLALGFGILKYRVLNLERRQNELEVIVEERTREIAKQAEELKALDKVKSRFFANVSHELRTPLTLILGPVSGIKSKPLGMLDEKEVRKNLDIVERNGQQLLGLIDEILDLSKLESRKLELNEKNSHLKGYLLRLFSSFESLAEIQGIHYRFDYNLPKDLIVTLDQDKMERIVNNFLSNAFKFTKKDGEIILSTSEKDGNLLFSVKDTGKGISPEDLPHVFERFFQSKSPLLKAQGGTGIGLALSDELAKLMDGRVWAESELNKGSSFYVQIPKKEASFGEELQIEVIKEAELITTKVEAPWVTGLKDQTILLVEDNRDMRAFVSSLLERNFNLIIAKNGEEGIQRLHESATSIDLIISDVMMPIMDGFTMIEQIKSNDYWRSLPVIMLTARAAEDDKIRALTVGVDDYLTKPFSTNELYARIKNLLHNYKARNLWKQELLLVAKDTKQNRPLSVEKEEQEASSIVSQQDLKWLKEVEKQIKTNISEENFDVEKLATQLLIGKRQLERKIKKITGLSPAKLVREVRLQTARDYLEKGNFSSVAEVSYAIGIQTPKYFVKIYTKRFGKKPKEYFK